VFWLPSSFLFPQELVAKYSHAIIPRDVKITDAEAVCPALKALLNDLLSKFMV